MTEAASGYYRIRMTFLTYNERGFPINIYWRATLWRSQCRATVSSMFGISIIIVQEQERLLCVRPILHEIVALRPHSACLWTAPYKLSRSGFGPGLSFSFCPFANR